MSDLPSFSPDLPDGTRVHLYPCHYCGCTRNGQITDESFPLTRLGVVLCGQVYCLTCYPKMIALLEADTKLELMKLGGSRQGLWGGGPDGDPVFHSTDEIAFDRARLRMMQS